MGRPDNLSRATLASVALLGALALGPAPALGADGSASGKFSSRNWDVPLGDAYAFRARSIFDDKPAILVAVSNTEIGEDALDRVYYRRHMLDEWFADEETRIVYLEFAPDGSYRGYTYYFESGDGCGYCGGGVSSTVKLQGGSLKGKLALQGKSDDEVSFDITLDVPIAPDDYGTALPAGGGDPAKTYLAYHAALEKADLAAMRRMLTARMLELWKKEEAKGNDEGFVDYLTDNRPKTVAVRQGFTRGDEALLLVEGQSDVLGSMYGEVHLRREGGAWKIDDETLQMGKPAD